MTSQWLSERIQGRHDPGPTVHWPPSQGQPLAPSLNLYLQPLLCALKYFQYQKILQGRAFGAAINLPFRNICFPHEHAMVWLLFPSSFLLTCTPSEQGMYQVVVSLLSGRSKPRSGPGIRPAQASVWEHFGRKQQVGKDALVLHLSAF